MAKTKQQKEAEIKVLADKLEKSKAVVFASYQGLNVKQTEDLRKALRAEGAELKMAKKRLLKIILKDNKLDESEVDNFDGSLTVAFGYEDETAPARVVNKFAKENETMQIFGGILEQSFINADKVKSLASLPTKEELLAKTVGTIKAPITGFVNVLAGNLRSLVYVLNAIKDNKN